jgi:xanthine dehydrogenase large subunit
LAVRRVNFYDTPGMDHGRRTTPMAWRSRISSPEIMAELEASSHYQARVAAVAAFNAQSTVLKKGIAMTPVKFGISFTTTSQSSGRAGAGLCRWFGQPEPWRHRNGPGPEHQGRAGGGRCLRHSLSPIRITATRTDKVPNTSATAASSGAI